MAYKITNDKTILIDKIVVGTPIRTVQSAGIPGVNATGAVQGDVLIYNQTTGLWEANNPAVIGEVDGGEY